MNKSAFLSTIADKVDITNKEAGVIWDTICGIAVEQLRETGVVILPTLIRITIKDIPAQAKRVGKHPFTGKEDHVFPAKPASKKLKVTIPKALKDATLK